MDRSEQGGSRRKNTAEIVLGHLCLSSGKRDTAMKNPIIIVGLLLLTIRPVSAWAAEVPINTEVEGQPLAANVMRLNEALAYLGVPLSEKTTQELTEAAKQRDVKKLQELIDPEVLFVVSINPEFRVKVARGPAKAVIQQGGFTPVLVKVLNDSTVSRELRIDSPQAGPVYSGASLQILERQAQTELNKNENTQGATDRFLEVEMFKSPPMIETLSGLEVEYAIALIYCHDAGKREATISFDVGTGTQDIGFRGEVPVLFEARPAIPVELIIRDTEGSPTVARLTFRDKLGHIYPPQAKRLAPDFFFQPQIYRKNGSVVLLPPGEFTLESCRGPEYKVQERSVQVPAEGPAKIVVILERWVDPAKFGFYCGDHHIHGAGCSHYQSPTQGVSPEDMFLQVKGEGLNVGCVLTWGPCFEFQRQFFSPTADNLSEPFTLLKYDLEISGFGSAALGHVCLLNLKNQTYPNSNGTKEKGWPTWTVPVLRWCKEQGGYTGYPHSAMYINATRESKRLLENHDQNRDQTLDRTEAEACLLPASFPAIDQDKNGTLSERELLLSLDRAADQLPNFAIPEMNGVGAMEICVSTAEGVCDFISAMDTARIPEWNAWYHIMNCGFPLKLSGETDFPCMSSRRVGQGRVYVQMGKIEKLDFAAWCEGLAKGRSYVSDGFAHALEFSVEGKTPGSDDVHFPEPGTVTVKAKVAFAEEVPEAVAYGQLIPEAGLRIVGDTVNLHAPRTDKTVKGGTRLIEIIKNGQAVAKKEIPADGKIHEVEFEVPLEQSSWIALRQFPQLHTNPVNVLINEKPIRASAESARWCAETIKVLWKNRQRFIAKEEQPAALETYERAIRRYEEIAKESPSNRMAP